MGCPSPAPDPKGRATEAQPSLCIGRYAGTESLRGRRGYPQRCAAITTQVVTAPQDVCGAARCVGTCARKSRQNTRPTVDCARPWKAENNENNPLTGVVCLLTKGVLIRVRRGFSLDFGAQRRVVPYAWGRPNASMLSSRNFTFCTLPLAVMGYSCITST